MEHYSTSICKEFRCASSWHSHLIRSAIFGKFYQGTLKSLKKHNTYKIHAYKIQGLFFLRSPKRRRQLRHRRTGLVKLSEISTSNRQYIFVRWLVGVGDLINYLNYSMALVGVGDVISCSRFVFLVDLVIVGDWKIPAV